MAKKTLTKSTVPIDSVSSLPNKPTITPSALKAVFDAYASGDRPYANGLVDELQDETLNTSGSFGIGHNSTNITADNVGDALEEVKSIDVNNVKITGNQTVNGIKTFVSSPIVPPPSTDFQTSTKKYVDDTTAGVVLGQIPDGSLTDVKLSNASGQIKDTVSATKARIFMLGGM